MAGAVQEPEFPRRNVASPDATRWRRTQHVPGVAARIFPAAVRNEAADCDAARLWGAGEARRESRLHHEMVVAAEAANRGGSGGGGSHGGGSPHGGSGRR